MTICAILARASALGLALMGQPLCAAEPPPSSEPSILLELNNAESPDPDLCQLILLTRNTSGQPILRAAWQFAIFDHEGRVRALPVIDFGALSLGKTRLVEISLPGRPCDEIRRIVVNDVAECQTEGENHSDLCLTQLVTVSRVGIAFGL